MEDHPTQVPSHTYPILPLFIHFFPLHGHLQLFPPLSLTPFPFVLTFWALNVYSFFQINSRMLACSVLTHNKRGGSNGAVSWLVIGTDCNVTERDARGSLIGSSSWLSSLYNCDRIHEIKGTFSLSSIS